jgi:hypothetical protein
MDIRLEALSVPVVDDLVVEIARKTPRQSEIGLRLITMVIRDARRPGLRVPDAVLEYARSIGRRRRDGSSHGARSSISPHVHPSRTTVRTPSRPASTAQPSSVPDWLRSGSTIFAIRIPR